MLQKSTFSGLHSVAIFVRLAVVIGSQICEITRNSKRIRVRSRSRSSKVMDLGVNRKRICDVLLDINSNCANTLDVSPTIEILTFKARKWLVFIPLPYLTPPLTTWGNTLEYLGETYPAKTKMVW